MTITDEDSRAADDDLYRDRTTALLNMLVANAYRHNQKQWGMPKEANPCGTTCCVAGWGLLANRGIVTIALDGEMSWDEKDMGRADEDMRFSWDADHMSDAQLQVPTLWRASYGHDARGEGAEWLGLSKNVAYALFEATADDSLVTPANQEAVAVEMLRRLVDGRIDRNGRVADSDVQAIDAWISTTKGETAGV